MLPWHKDEEGWSSTVIIWAGAGWSIQPSAPSDGQGSQALGTNPAPLWHGLE